MSLPPPTTFEQGQRKLYGLAAGIAGIAMGMAVMVGGYIVIYGKWTPAQETLRLSILSTLLAAGCLNTTIVIVGLLVGGPVGKLDVKKGDMDINAEGAGQ